jgi:hypothetical protein
MMDLERFDALLRRLALARDRRGVLRAALVAGAMVLIAGGRQAAGQDACGCCSDGEVCRDGACVRLCAIDRDCRSKNHDDPCMLNTCVDGLCLQAIADCLPGYECCRGACCPQPCVSDSDCAVADPCRWGTCGIAGVCEFIAVDSCVPCASSLDCAGNEPNTICCDGVCRRPCPEGTIMGKGCECHADASGTKNGLVVRDDASG